MSPARLLKINPRPAVVNVLRVMQAQDWGKVMDARNFSKTEVQFQNKTTIHACGTTTLNLKNLGSSTLIVIDF